MHASYQIIIQVLQLAYTTQACISNLKNLCNASKHITMHKSNTINQSSWACSPYLCVSIVQEFLILLNSSMLLPLCPCPCPTSTSTSLSQSFPKLSYLCTISPSLSPISIKGVLLFYAKACIWGRWLILESCIFDGHHLYSSLDTMCRILWPWYQL